MSPARRVADIDLKYHALERTIQRHSKQGHADEMSADFMLRHSLSVLVLVPLLTTSADANCICRCLDGRMQPLCSPENDTPAFCDPTPCGALPASSPTASPGGAQCSKAKILNPKTG